MSEPYVELQLLNGAGEAIQTRRIYREEEFVSVPFFYHPNARWRIYATKVADIDVEVTMSGTRTSRFSFDPLD